MLHMNEKDAKTNIMKKKITVTLLLLLLVLSALFITSCTESTPYDGYDEEGYNVSIRYDANGGMFTTNVSVITDSYSIAGLAVNENGKVEIALLAPDDSRRGQGNYFTANNAGYFLAGWYTERKPVTNASGEALDVNGKLLSETNGTPAYTYSGRWDFDDDRMEIDPNATHSASEPITLYAAWISFGFEFYSLDSGELISTYTFNPANLTELLLPFWNEETGKLDMQKFPKIDDKTLSAIYLDAEGSVKVEGTSLTHTGSFDPETATATAPVMKLYLDYTDGEWYHIYTAEQFIDNATVNGCYEICADLDFSEEIWKTALIHNSFKGKIIGNGYTFRNITVEQTDTRKQYAGLFGAISAGAVIEDLCFDNILFTVSNGTLQQDAAFGILAGTIDASASVKGIRFSNATLAISSSANIPDDISLGLVCGVGSVNDIDLTGMTAIPVGDVPDSITVTVNGNEVVVRSAE